MSKRTKVFIIAALSADGIIAVDAEHAVDWSSKEDKQKYISLTKKAGVMIMGKNTFDTIGKTLAGRKTVVYTHGNLDNLDVTTTSAPAAELIEQLAQEGYEEIAICGGQKVYDLFLRSGVVDEIYLTIEPIIFGKGLSLFASPTEKKLKLISSEKLNDDTLFVKYKVIHGNPD